MTDTDHARIIAELRAENERLTRERDDRQAALQKTAEPDEAMVNALGDELAEHGVVIGNPLAETALRAALEAAIKARGQEWQR